MCLVTTLAPVFMAKRLPTNALLVRLEAPRASAEVGEAEEAPSGMAKGRKEPAYVGPKLFPRILATGNKSCGQPPNARGKGKAEMGEKGENFYTAVYSILGRKDLLIHSRHPPLFVMLDAMYFHFPPSAMHE